MTKGVAGIGKTILVQKFILDWADGIAIQNVDFIFPLSFRELNLVMSDQFSFDRLLTELYPELKELEDSENYQDCQVVFIFDGLDESRIPLNFQPKMWVSDVKQTSSVSALVRSLIQGTLFPSALIWVTSRPAAASQIPLQKINLMTEVQGFSNPQKEEYFRKRISDESRAKTIISHIKASKSLHIMCHIPVFCWIAAMVLQQMLEQDNNQEIPKTLTEMFIHFLLIQTARTDQKYHAQNKTDVIKPLASQKKHILKLSELAFKNLENGNVMFYEEDLREYGIDISDTVYSGMCTEIFKEESLFHQKKVYCFVHLSIQEFLAALHIFVSYTRQMETMGTFFCLEEALKWAVTKVLESSNGHLDLFLRFLLGISLERNQSLLQGLLNRTHSSSASIQRMCQYIKELNNEDLSPERYISLLQCLFEMHDHSMHKEIQQYLKAPRGSKQKLSPAHCSALAHMLLMSDEVLDEFDLKQYNTSDEGRRRLLPAVGIFRKALLNACKINKISCNTVKRSLQSANSMIELDLSHNDLGQCGVHTLAAGLTSPYCKLQILRSVDYVELPISHMFTGPYMFSLLLFLRLDDCNLSEETCMTVASVLHSASSLIELDLSNNDLGDSGVQLLSTGLCNPNCKLQTLRLSACLISVKSCDFLASSLTSNPHHLKELDLSYNHPGQSGTKRLSEFLKDPHCKLETIKYVHRQLYLTNFSFCLDAFELTLDPNTAGSLLSLDEGNRAAKYFSDKLPYPDHPDRFDWGDQVLCRESQQLLCQT
ncbi:hypothetical protein ACEWY4_008513 [Coilia grayii]|uniref:NACHT domain-containing protein n=1 Tax=Coilia grayii TaxID=363190 RepID=A0ABD1KB64_9TELE